MRQRPWILVLLAALHLLAPVVNLYINSTWARMDFFHYLDLYFEPHNIEKNWPNLALPIFAGISIYLCKKWSFFLYLLAISGLFLKSYFGYLERTQEVSLFYLLSVYAVNISVVAYFLIPAVRKIYFDPRMRWWETLPRYHFNQQCTYVDEGVQFHGEALNISEGGAFIQSENVPKDKSVIQIDLNYQNLKIQVVGSVIIHQGIKTPGFGVKFAEDTEQSAGIKKLIQILHSEGRIIEYRHKGESLKDWLKGLIKGKGLVPQAPRKKD